MASHQITGVRKPDRNSLHEHITHVCYGGYRWTREYVIGLIEAGTDSFYILNGGKRSEVGVVHPNNGRKPFLRSYADGYHNDNLLALPEC